MDFITVIISLAALLLSLLSYLRERRLITVDFDTNCFVLDVTKNIKAADNIFEDSPSLLISPFGPRALENFIIDLPKSRCGPITSGSCLELPILIVLNKTISIEEGVSIEFKIPQYAWLPWHRSSVSTSNRKKI